MVSIAHAQSPADGNVDPREYGLEIPSGPLRAIDKNKLVKAKNERGETVVARVHAQVGQHYVLLLPDGSLIGRAIKETQSADAKSDPFVAESKESIAKRLATGQLSGFKIKTTKHYVYIYNTSDEFALATNRILESMVPGVMTYTKGQKIEVHEPEVPLIVIMFRTEGEFQRFQRMPPGVLAYYNTITNRVVLYEESTNTDLKPELWQQQAISTIAHEGVHQILHNIGVQQRLSQWPMWLAEGIAEFMAPTTFTKRMTWKGAGQVNDMRMFELEYYLKARPADGTDGQLIEHSVLAARLTSTGYATSWALTHFLARNRAPQFHKFMAELSKLGPFEGATNIVAPGVVKENKALFTKYFGDDFADLEKKLVQHLKKQPYNAPYAEYPHYAVLITLPPMAGKTKREANVFHTRKLAEKWIRDTIEKLPEDDRKSSTVRMQSQPNRAQAELLVRTFLAGK